MSKLTTGTPVSVWGSPWKWRIAFDDGGKRVTVERVVTAESTISGAVGKIARRTVLRSSLRKPNPKEN